MSHDAETIMQKIQREQQQPRPPPPQLPTPRNFLTDLLGSLPGQSATATRDAGRTDDRTAARAAPIAAAASSTNANPLRGLQGNARNVFLTLHVLFPNELLPALDLLDRGLVTRFLVGSGERLQFAAADTTTSSSGGGCEAEAAEAAPAETIGPSEAGNDDDQEDDPARPASAAAAAAPSSHAPGRHRQLRRRSAEQRTGRPPPPALPLYYVRSAQQQQQQQQQQQYHQYRHRSRHGLIGDEDDASASASSSSSTAGNHYEVRLAAWNCSCPAFAFAAFPANLAEPSPSPPPPPPPPALTDEGAKAGEAEDAVVLGEEKDGVPEADRDAAGTSGGGALGEDAGVGDGGGDVWERFGFGGLRRGGGEGGDVPPVCKHLLASLLVERAPELFAGCVEERAVSVEEAAAWAAGWGG